MFCDGKCIKGRKKCGLLYTLTFEETLTGKIENIEKCAFHFIIDSLVRIEKGDIRLQAAIESSRNENANADHKMSSIVATGFMGMLHAFNEDPDKFKNSLNILKQVAIKEDQALLGFSNKKTT
jgi:hypothetical protein